jgi:hypothetical protein
MLMYDYDGDESEPGGYYAGDHEFQSADGSERGRCIALLDKIEGSWHAFAPNKVLELAGGGEEPAPDATCLQRLPEGYVCSEPYDDPVHVPVRECGLPASSVVHPPDQFRHWCSVLEAGGDCMHLEGVPW